MQDGNLYADDGKPSEELEHLKFNKREVSIMNTMAKFEVIGAVMDTLETEIENVNSLTVSSTKDLQDRIDELSQTFSGEDLDNAIEESWRIKSAKTDIERYTLQCKILTHLKDYLYDNFQKILK